MLSLWRELYCFWDWLADLVSNLVALVDLRRHWFEFLPSSEVWRQAWHFWRKPLLRLQLAENRFLVVVPKHKELQVNVMSFHEISERYQVEVAQCYRTEMRIYPAVLWCLLVLITVGLCKAPCRVSPYRHVETLRSVYPRRNRKALDCVLVKRHLRLQTQVSEKYVIEVANFVAEKNLIRHNGVLSVLYVFLDLFCCACRLLFNNFKCLSIRTLIVFIIRAIYVIALHLGNKKLVILND